MDEVTLKTSEDVERVLRKSDTQVMRKQLNNVKIWFRLVMAVTLIITTGKFVLKKENTYMAVRHFLWAVASTFAVEDLVNSGICLLVMRIIILY